MLSFFNLERIIIAVLLACVVFVSYYTYSTHRKYTATRITIENQALQIENREIQKEYLTQSVKLSEESNAKLLKERASLAKINEQYNDELIKLNSQYITSQQQIKNLRNSIDEHTKKWASDCVPASAIGLLSNARAENCHANSSANAVQIRNTPEKLN